MAAADNRDEVNLKSFNFNFKFCGGLIVLKIIYSYFHICKPANDETLSDFTVELDTQSGEKDTRGKKLKIDTFACRQMPSFVLKVFISMTSDYFDWKSIA